MQLIKPFMCVNIVQLDRVLLFLESIFPTELHKREMAFAIRGMPSFENWLQIALLNIRHLQGSTLTLGKQFPADQKLEA